MGVTIESYLHFVENGTFVLVLTFCFQIQIKTCIKRKVNGSLFFFLKPITFLAMAGDLVARL